MAFPDTISARAGMPPRTTTRTISECARAAARAAASGRGLGLPPTIRRCDKASGRPCGQEVPRAAARTPGTARRPRTAGQPAPAAACPTTKTLRQPPPRGGAAATAAAVGGLHADARHLTSPIVNRPHPSAWTHSATGDSCTRLGGRACRISAACTCVPTLCSPVQPGMAIIYLFFIVTRHIYRQTGLTSRPDCEV